MRAVSKSYILLFALFALHLSLCSSSMAQLVGRIESMKLLTPEVGWAATKHTLFWTGDAGAHWKEITPNTKRGYMITSVFFLDVSHGWVLLAHGGAEDPKTGIADTLFDLGNL